MHILGQAFCILIFVVPISIPSSFVFFCFVNVPCSCHNELNYLFHWQFSLSQNFLCLANGSVWCHLKIQWKLLLMHLSGHGCKFLKLAMWP